jgi:serine/threonine-protein kinase
MWGQVILGKYKVTRQLDEGGMCKVFLARQANPERDVAIKVLKESMQSHPKAVEHFRREIHIMSRFQHPHAVAYIDSTGGQTQSPALVMEYLRGTDLGTLLARQGRFTPERAGRLLVQLCDVLQAAHAAGIVHRDIKPGNLMVLHPGTPQETLKLMDFGLARMASLLYISPEELGDNGLPGAAGTPEYICPEQVRGTDMDGRGDLYSVGVVLYEMLTARRPFESDDAERLMLAHESESPPPFAAKGVAGVVPAVIESLVRSCLAKYPDGRPKDAAELARRYEQALGKRIAPTRLTCVGPASVVETTPPPPRPTAPMPHAARPAEDHNALRQSFEACMPEVMAMMKIKGFIFDLGGEVVESVPGMIRVRLVERQPAKKRSGLFALIGRGGNPPAAPAATTDIELHMERKDPRNTSQLTITLVMRPGGGPASPEWLARCSQVSRDLKGYLMGR